MKQTDIFKILSLVAATLGITGFLLFFLIMERTEDNFIMSLPALFVGLASILYLVFKSFKREG